MNDHELQRLLAESLEAGARAAVPEHSPVPPPRFLTDTRSAVPTRRGRWLAPLAAAAAVVAAVSIAVVTLGRGTDGGNSAAAPSSSGGSVGTVSPAARSVPTAPASGQPRAVVRVTTITDDAATYGVGMPVIAYFSARITDARAWQAGTTVTVDGRPITAAWYFEPSSAGNGPYEAHLRPQDYWPAHSAVTVRFPPSGTSLGGEYVSGGGPSEVSFRTGARTVSTIDSDSHRMTVTSDGRTLGSFPVSLGASATPTFSGTKVIMQKTPTTCMKDVAGSFDECGIKWDQRLTYSGEYLHAAPWNVDNIGQRNTSNGCTNLLPADAEKLYSTLEIGDVVTYPNASGPAMTMGQGYGDWNVSWSQWLTGGAVPTR